MTKILGIGGSATNDGGSGMLTALGVKFLNSDNEEIELGGGALAHLTHIDASNLDYRLNDVTFEVACDVTNPLLGLMVHIYLWTTKGATEKMIPKLDSALANYHDMIEKHIISVLKIYPVLELPVD